MLSLSSGLVSKLQSGRSEEWTDIHVSEMADLLPEVAAMYDAAEFRSLIIRILHRADLKGLRAFDSTVAFCYASLTLGVAFEDRREHPWFAQTLGQPEELWAQGLWEGLRSALALDPGGVA